MVAIALIDSEDAWVLDHRWHLNAYGYAVRSHGKAKIYMHREIVGPAATGEKVDHINRDTLDNRRWNLRPLSHAENCQNRARQRGEKIRGVTARPNGKWQGHIRVMYKRLHLGTFDTQQDAADAVSVWRRANVPTSATDIDATNGRVAP